MIDETQAPGCYGSALTYDMGSAECSQCMFAAQCGPKSAERMRYIREKLNLPERKTTRRQVVTPAKPQPVEMSLPKKVVELLDRIDRAGIKVTERLKRRENPFVTPRFMKIACQVLLLYPQGISLAALIEIYVRKLGWNKKTAAAHAVQARHALIALGAAEEHNDKLRLK